MSSDIQDRFAAALIDRALPPPQGTSSWNGPRPERRFAVYRNNVASGLTGALATRFPAARRIVGEEFFTAMALAYAERHPPRSPLLLFYGDDFADFVAGFEQARDLAYLPDVMRLEAARGHAYHAADAMPLDPAALAQVASDRLPDLVFSPHPSLSILSSAHPVVTIWAMNGGGLEPGPIKPWIGETALVVRPRLLVDILRLEPAEAAFLQALAGGAPLGAAAENAGALPGFDLAAALVRLLRSGAFTAIRKDNTDGH